MKLTPVFFASVLFAVQACASAPSVTYRHIADPQQLFSAADWTPELDGAVKSAGKADLIPQIQAALNEKGAWPDKMRDGDARWLHMRTITRYNVEEVAALTYYDKPAVLLRVPANANGHMDDGWKPKSDFYIVVSTDAFTKPASLPN